jgi:transcription initiation factor TFIIIB Brf1 subunit/transcription initiation factor TFIIB
MIGNIHDIKECPQCGSLDLVYRNAQEQVVCKDCGMIFEPLPPAEEEEFERVAGINSAPVKKTAKKATKKKK